MEPTSNQECLVIKIHREGKPDLHLMKTDDGRIWAEMYGIPLVLAYIDGRDVATVEGVNYLEIDYMIDPQGLGNDEIREGFTVLLPSILKMFEGKATSRFGRMTAQSYN